MEKNDIRLEVKKRIEKMSEVEREKESGKVSRELITLLTEKSFQTLVSYDPMSDEVDISGVNEWAQRLRKDVIIFDQKLREVPELNGTEIICIAPGRAFTHDGKRLGRWIGFYDRLLAKNPKMLPIGVCFSVQLFDELPQDTWDIKVSQVVFDRNALE